MCLQTQRGEGRKEVHAGTRGALQICMGILTAAELHGTPKRVTNNVRSAWSVHLLFKSKEMRCVPCKGVILNKCSKGWLMLANVT